eukprot:TRINITY_DN2436_c0_g1_i2.p1 TRINITY_DN2436_c0_g1~~TRINITY_DN2436_c0_g1_i2.p1  ORF type:complete len:509 (+),score=86.80 TRINITY_DN2436_c0_g1_i2:101-1627(+)
MEQSLVVIVTTISLATVAYLLFGKRRCNRQKKFYQQNNFLPVSHEISAHNLTISQGSIPEVIDGIFIRNGPNPLGPDQDNFHWFEGFGMLHSVRIHKGIASYSNKYVETDSFLVEKQNPGFHLSAFHVQGISGLISMFWQQFLASLGYRNRYNKNTANTALAFHAGRFMALMEADAPHVLNADSLQTYGRHNWNGKLKHSFTAHPKVDPKTGELLFFGYQILRAPYLFYSSVGPDGELRKSVALAGLSEPRMYHDFAITQNYSVFFDYPLVFEKKNIFSEKSLFQFYKDRPSRLGVLPRSSSDGKDIKWFNVGTGYVFHSANAWEEGDCIHVYVCLYDSSFEFDNLECVAHLYKYSIHLLSGEVFEELVLPNYGLEFPVINESYMGYKNNYIYGVITQPKVGMHGLLKYDICTKKVIAIETKDDLFGEFVFVPNDASEPDQRTEDDGWLVGYVYVEKKQNSELVILRAQDLTVQARVVLPQRVPQGFHGKWITKEMLVSQKGFLPGSF